MGRKENRGRCWLWYAGHDAPSFPIQSVSLLQYTVPCCFFVLINARTYNRLYQPPISSLLIFIVIVIVCALGSLAPAVCRGCGHFDDL